MGPARPQVLRGRAAEPCPGPKLRPQARGASPGAALRGTASPLGFLFLPDSGRDAAPPEPLPAPAAPGKRGAGRAPAPVPHGAAPGSVAPLPAPGCFGERAEQKPARKRKPQGSAGTWGSAGWGLPCVGPLVPPGSGAAFGTALGARRSAPLSGGEAGGVARWCLPQGVPGKGFSWGDRIGCPQGAGAPRAVMSSWWQPGQ